MLDDVKVIAGSVALGFGFALVTTLRSEVGILFGLLICVGGLAVILHRIFTPPLDE